MKDNKNGKNIFMELNQNHDLEFEQIFNVN